MRLFDLYKGSFVDGIKEGFGTFVWPDSEGEWKKDEPTYEGECCDGANHGCSPLIDASCWFVQREKRIREIRFAYWSRISRRVEEGRAEWKGQDEVAGWFYVRG